MTRIPPLTKTQYRHRIRQLEESKVNLKNTIKQERVKNELIIVSWNNFIRTIHEVTNR